MSSTEIVRAARRSVSRVSDVLAALRVAEMVRHDTDGRRGRYRLKHPRAVRKLLDALAGFVNTASTVRS